MFGTCAHQQLSSQVPLLPYKTNVRPFETLLATSLGTLPKILCRLRTLDSMYIVAWTYASGQISCLYKTHFVASYLTAFCHLLCIVLTWNYQHSDSKAEYSAQLLLQQAVPSPSKALKVATLKLLLVSLLLLMPSEP